MPGRNLGSVVFVTMGCAKNEVDSNDMADLLVQAGYTISNDPETADVIVVNTCSFIQAATEESIDAILEAAGLDNVAAGKSHLVVSGCMPARYGDDLQRELVEVDAFLPCADEGNIVALVDSLLDVQRMAGDKIAFDAVSTGALRATESPFAYVKISDGCDRFCAYCTIPYIRGRYHSYTPEEVFRAVEGALAKGAREIVFIAQDTGRWGNDFEEPLSLAWLVCEAAEKWPLVWFRVMYIQPEGITDELLKAVATHDNICSYFDIPFQHCEARVLKSMNRKGSALDYLKLIERIRTAIPDVTLRTTLIAGFPGETDEEFESLCDFVEQIAFDYVGVFPYSREEGTRAYSLEGQIDEDEKMYRAQQLRDIADACSAAVIAQRIGKTTDVLVCGFEEDGQIYGRAMCQAPDVDGVTYVDSGTCGDIVSVRIDDTLLYEMEGSSSGIVNSVARL